MNTKTLPYIKEVTNKDLMYSPGKSTQDSVITYEGEKWIYVFV